MKKNLYFKDKVFIFTAQSLIPYKYSPDFFFWNFTSKVPRVKTAKCGLSAPLSKQFCSGAEHFKSKESPLRELKIYLNSAAIYIHVSLLMLPC